MSADQITRTKPRDPETADGGLQPLDTFARRHLGSNPSDLAEMLRTIGAASLEELTAQTVPAAIRLSKPLDLPAALGESEALAALRAIAQKNKVCRSFIGQGYYDTITPPVILRNILENPGWYTQYTPYQAEISQGRLEALLNFQTMVADLTALPIANASMLDEATAAAEAMHMCHSVHEDRNKFFVAQDCHPQTIAVVKTRAKWLGIEIEVGDAEALLRTPDGNPVPSTLDKYSGILVQYPTTDGRIVDYSPLVEAAHKAGTLIVAATDLLALTLIKPPGEWNEGGTGGGADIAVGSAQRFGVPMGFGGPHAAFMACKTEFTRKLPGRIVGVSKDAAGNPAYRLALQTREQHIRREKATSNICTAQVLLAIMASMYAVYHGPDGLKAIATRVASMAHNVAAAAKRSGHKVVHDVFFDTVVVQPANLPRQDEKLAKMIEETVDDHWGTRSHAGGIDEILKGMKGLKYNVRTFSNGTIAISVDETTDRETVASLEYALQTGRSTRLSAPMEKWTGFPTSIERKSEYLRHPVFNAYHSEHEMLRYITRLQSKDLSLTTSMIPLGSCTMKLNATSEMLPVTWPEFANMHPFAPAGQTAGYQQLFQQLEAWLAKITGFAAVSLQPNAGSQGEYAGLLAIRAYHEAMAAQAAAQDPSSLRRSVASSLSPRDICLIPTSAHGTNPASAVVAGLKVVPVACDSQGNIDIADLQKQAAEHSQNLACIMVTYPSTHGVFEESIKEICQIVHSHGGQVYMDGANMNAQVGLTSPGFIGADVCHLNLHKTFCIPHGGGGPGVGPIAVAKHLAPFLPRHPLTSDPLASAQLPITNYQLPAEPTVVSAAPYGSASILPISWMYIAMMGEPGLRAASQVAILNANYMAKRLEAHYPILFRGKNGRCAHEFILDCRHFEESAGVKVEDIAKRLMDYGFHAPTMSWPVPGTLMFEPTESESKAELDRLCDAMISIREEIRAIAEGRADRKDNPLKNAPHTVAAVTANEWPHPYTREQAAFPMPALRAFKFWPAVARIDNPWGDRHLMCTCQPMSTYSS